MILSIWIIALSIQLLIVLILASQFLRYKQGKPTDTKISVIIAAHNEVENLKKHLPVLMAQDHPDYEIVIALDRSNDGSAELLRSMGYSNIKIVDITSTPSGWDHKKFALTRAIEKATGEWLIFTDADCYPESQEWLSSCTRSMQRNTDIVLGYSPYERSGPLLLQNFIQYETFVTAFHYLSMAITGNPYMGVGRNLAIRKSFFEEKNGYEAFKSTMGGDDDLFIQEYGTVENTRVLLGPVSITRSIPKKTWRSYIHQKNRHLSVGKKYGIVDQFLHVVFHISLLVTWLLMPFNAIQNIIPIILFYLFVKGIGYRFAQSKMGAGFNYILLPLVDWMYAIFLPTVALRSRLIKDNQWKKK